MVTHQPTGTLIADQVICAHTIRTRAKGLLGHATLPQGNALWIRPCSSIHMFFMRFPIDAVFIDRNHRVTRIVRNLKPWHIAFGGRGAHSVLELPAHSCPACVQPNDPISIHPR